MSTSTPTSLRPEDVDGLRAAILDTTGPIGIAGAGTAPDWAGALGPVDAVLDTTALTGVIAHNPGDMTVSVRAGTPLRALVEELAPHGTSRSTPRASRTGRRSAGCWRRRTPGRRRWSTARCATSSSASRSCSPTARSPTAAAT